MQIRLFILAFFLTINVKAQTINEKYDLNFQDVNKCIWSWGWLQGKIRSKFSSLNLDSGKLAIKASYDNLGGGKTMEFVLTKTIILPKYQKNKKCEVSIISKTEARGDLLFIVKSISKDQQERFSKTIKINSGQWNKHSTTFTLSDEKAIKVSLYYIGDSLPDQTVWLDQVGLMIDGKDIGAQNYFSKKKEDSLEVVNSLNKAYLTPLTKNNDSTLLRNIPELADKKIIGLGECTHGSKTVKAANYQFIKNLIVNHKCRLVLLEKPIDITMIWNLYVQGKIGNDYDDQLLADIKISYIDAKQLLDFLKWLRSYNQQSKSKVHILGIDNYISPKLYLFEYHLALLGKEKGKYYLRKIEEGNNADILQTAQRDSVLKSLLGEQDFRFYLSYVENCPISTENLISKDSRDLNMLKRVELLMEIYLNEGEKVAVHAHKKHLSAMDFDAIPERYVPLGFHLRKKYNSQYFAISFQVGKGTYTQDLCSGFGQNLTDTLKAPPVHSFEYAGLMSGHDYFYYPSKYLGDAILSHCQIVRGSRYKDFYEFSSAKKSFDAYVFIRESTALDDVEKFPMFYAGAHVSKKTRNMNAILKELKD